MALSINSSFATSPGTKFARVEQARKADGLSISAKAAGRAEESRASRIERGADTAEISDVALWFSTGRASGARASSQADAGRVRGGLVESIRQMIESGAYDTTERLDAAADAMIESL